MRIDSINQERRALLRKLARSNERLEWPAIYSSRELMREVKRERKEIVARLRDLPLAG